jgi:hypothetical protein
MNKTLWRDVLTKSGQHPYVSLLSAASLAWLGWENRQRHFEHTTYGGANGAPDPERGLGHATRELLTGDPDSGGARSRMWHGVPRIRPMSTANERFLARVLEAHIVRTLVLASAGVSEDDERWHQLHIPQGFVEQHLAHLRDTKRRASRAVKQEMTDDTARSSLLAVKLPDKSRMTADELQEASIHKWSVTREQAALFLRAFLAVEHVADGHVGRRERVDRARDLSKTKQMKMLRLATGYLNETKCIHAVLQYELGSPEHTHESVAVNVGAGVQPSGLPPLQGNIGVGVTKTSGVTRTRHRKMPSGIDVVWFDPACLRRLTSQKDAEVLERLKQQPDALKQIGRQLAAYPLTFGVETALLGLGALGTGAVALGAEAAQKRLTQHMGAKLGA